MLHFSLEYKFSNEPTRDRLEHPLFEVLESVHETGSILKAAKQLGRSYRYVWGELKHWEAELNTHLIVWGRTSKGAELTPQALQFLQAITQTHLEFEQQVAVMKNRIAACLAVLDNSTPVRPLTH
jgi:putative molybdopterin biosynthesis protein